MKRKWLEYLLNLAFWLFTAWLLIRSFSIVAVEQFEQEGIEITTVVRDADLSWKLVLLVSLSALLFYTNLYHLIIASIARRPAQLMLRSALLFFATILLHTLVVQLPFFSDKAALPGGIVWGTIIFYFTVSVSYGLVKRLVQRELQHQQLLAAKTRAELHLLRAQLQPHFLFNVLNNLLSLVDQVHNPTLARAIDKLSDLLRYVVEGTSAGPVPVKQEITFLQNYVELQQLRFAEGEVELIWDISGPYQEQKVEPGLFLPLVENAFKYGAAPEVQTTIRIQFDLNRSGQLGFRISNELLSGLPEHIPSLGTGIKTVRERLQLVYPKRHELAISNQSSFTVDLKIMTNADDYRR